MWDVVAGGALAIVGGILGGLGGVLVQGYLNREGERRAEDRARQDRLREFHADSLRVAYRQFVALAEHARAAQAGEAPEQIARLRTQIESTASLGADARLFGPEGVGPIADFIQGLMVLLAKPPGSGITRNEVAELAVHESRLALLYVAAMERILADAATP
jgi:hypothetical protein